MDTPASILSLFGTGSSNALWAKQPQLRLSYRRTSRKMLVRVACALVLFSEGARAEK
jgi:hypothetical protein